MKTNEEIKAEMNKLYDHLNDPEVKKELDEKSRESVRKYGTIRPEDLFIVFDI